MEAAAGDPTPPPAEEAGPLSHMNDESLETLLASQLSPSQNPATEEAAEPSGEQALESHEVMELQAFSERKEWILDKIKVRSSVLLPSRLPSLMMLPKSFSRACLPSNCLPI